MKKQFLLIVSILLLSIQIVSAQTPPAVPKQISGGILNGKAVALPKPAYPAAARAVGAEGAVNVQITIDEEGNVISASAVSGHPLLQAAAVQAAQQAKFNTTTLSGQAVKVTGVLVYNFVAGQPAMNWFKVGYDLANVQHAPSLISLNTDMINRFFQPEWTTEKNQLQKLAEIKQAESSKISPPTIIGERKIEEKSEKSADGTTVKTIVTERAVKSDYAPDAEQVSISESLIASLQSRLASDEMNLWQFNSGVSLSWAVSQLRFSPERQRVLGALRQQIQSAPSGVSPEYLTELQKAAAILEKPSQTAEDREQMRQIMSKLFKN